MYDPHLDSNHLAESMGRFLYIHSGYKMEVTNPDKQMQETHIYRVTLV